MFFDAFVFRIKMFVITLPSLVVGAILGHYCPTLSLSIIVAIMLVVTLYGFVTMVWTDASDGNPPDDIKLAMFAKFIFFIFYAFCISCMSKLDPSSQEVAGLFNCILSLISLKMFWNIGLFYDADGSDLDEEGKGTMF